MKRTEVPQPIGCGTERNRLGSDGQLEDFTCDTPDTASPRRSKTGDVDADESNESTLCVWVLAGIDGADDCNDQFAGRHPEGSPDEDFATAKSFDSPHAWQCADYIDDVGRNDEQERISLSCRFEVARAVVEDDWRIGQMVWKE